MLPKSVLFFRTTSYSASARLIQSRGWGGIGFGSGLDGAQNGLTPDRRS